MTCAELCHRNSNVKKRATQTCPLKRHRCGHQHTGLGLPFVRTSAVYQSTYKIIQIIGTWFVKLSSQNLNNLCFYKNKLLKPLQYWNLKTWGFKSSGDLSRQVLGKGLFFGWSECGTWLPGCWAIGTLDEEPVAGGLNSEEAKRLISSPSCSWWPPPARASPGREAAAWGAAGAPAEGALHLPLFWTNPARTFAGGI